MSELGFIHRWVPPATGSKRVLLLLHGTGADETNLLLIGRALDEHAGLLSPRGRVVEDGKVRFFRRGDQSHFDEEDVRHRAHELAHFVIAAIAKYEIDPDGMVVIGYSNGANIAAAMMLLRPEVVKAAILFRAMVGLTNVPAPDLNGTRVLISNGKDDPIIPVTNGERLAILLRAGGADVIFQVQPAAHNLVQEDLVSAAHWLGTVNAPPA
jgi:phospholipase/carboxylesterase